MDIRRTNDLREEIAIRFILTGSIVKGAMKGITAGVVQQYMN